MYRVGGKDIFAWKLSPIVSFCHLDYVYFEGTPTEPYLIRRIEELNKVDFEPKENPIESILFSRLPMEMSKHVSLVSIDVVTFHRI